MSFRGSVSGGLGGRYWINAADVRQGLRFVHDNCIGSILADGLQEHLGGN